MPECQIWDGGITVHGYGYVYLDGKQEKAHRVAWQLYRGEIPQGLCVLHHCDIRLCVNPNHLFLGTRSDNLRDMTEKGRRVSGERHGMSKLTADQVKQIRESNETQAKIATNFGVSRSLVGFIKQNKRWKERI
jgi:hypothetical protein